MKFREEPPQDGSSFSFHLSYRSSEQNFENSTDLVVNAVQDNLHINLNHTDINVAHRLGSKGQNKERPIIVKLLNRSKKSEIMDAYVKVKPSLYVN